MQILAECEKERRAVKMSPSEERLLFYGTIFPTREPVKDYTTRPLKPAEVEHVCTMTKHKTARRG